MQPDPLSGLLLLIIMIYKMNVSLFLIEGPLSSTMNYLPAASLLIIHCLLYYPLQGCDFITPLPFRSCQKNGFSFFFFFNAAVKNARLQIPHITPLHKHFLFDANPLNSSITLAYIIFSVNEI